MHDVALIAMIIGLLGSLAECAAFTAARSRVSPAAAFISSKQGPLPSASEFERQPEVEQ
jgi:hypothetical protein